MKFKLFKELYTLVNSIDISGARQRSVPPELILILVMIQKVKVLKNSFKEAINLLLILILF